MSNLETQIGNVLTKVETGKIKFSLGAISIDANSYKQVKTNIDNGKIKVVYSNKIGADAKYRYTSNTLSLGFQVVDTSDKEALIIHECTHAACDIAGKALLVTHSEAAAYVAQCLYFYYINETALANGNTPTFKLPILQAAWDVATKARQNSSLSNKDIEKLLAEIAKHPMYKDRATQDENYDGVS
jgi:hypothetical protein